MNIGKESEKVEFKESTSEIKTAIESLAAMLNKHGQGTVFFGVKDNGDVKGQLVGKDTANDISKAIATKIKPKVIPTISIHQFKNISYIEVSVKGNKKPYWSDGYYLIRIGCQNLKLEPNEIRDLVNSSEGDIMIERIAFNQNLTFNQLKQLFIAKGITINNKMFYENNNLLTNDNKLNLLADVLSDNNNWSIKVCRFATTDKTELIERKEFGYKCILLAMEQALIYTEAFNETRVKLSGKAQREEKHLFNSKCLREAWINACLHNKWSMGVPPVIYIFSNRIEIVSTGGLPIDFPKKDFFNGKSRPVNYSLQKIMGQLGIVEQTGHGVPIIVSEYGQESYDFSQSFITVTLKFNFESRLQRTTYDGLNQNEINVLKALENDSNLTISNLQKISGLSYQTVSRILKKLKELGKIKRIGSNKTGYWEIIK